MFEVSSRPVKAFSSELCARIRGSAFVISKILAALRRTSVSALRPGTFAGAGSIERWWRTARGSAPQMLEREAMLQDAAKDRFRESAPLRRPI